MDHNQRVWELPPHTWESLSYRQDTCQVKRVRGPEDRAGCGGSTAGALWRVRITHLRWGTPGPERGESLAQGQTRKPEPPNAQGMQGCLSSPRGSDTYSISTVSVWTPAALTPSGNCTPTRKEDKGTDSIISCTKLC